MIIGELDTFSTHQTAPSARRVQPRNVHIDDSRLAWEGELSVDISGPFMRGLPVTDRREKEELWPRYMVVGAFTSYTPKEATDRYEQERRDRIAQGLEGPVLMEQTISEKGQTLYFVEVVATRKETEVAPAVLRIINRINNIHKTKAVYRLHADRARELSGETARDMFEAVGITVTSTANYDSNANGRAERAVLFFQEKTRTLLSSRIRSEHFQKQIKTLWTFAVQHVGELHINAALKRPECKYEFGQRILARVANPESKLQPRLQAAVFLGLAPNVTSGCYVMRSDGTIELTSNITDDTPLGEQEEVLKDGVVPKQAGPEKKPP